MIPRGHEAEFFALFEITDRVRHICSCRTAVDLRVVLLLYGVIMVGYVDYVSQDRDVGATIHICVLVPGNNHSNNPNADVR